MFAWFSHIKPVQMMILYEPQKRFCVISGANKIFWGHLDVKTKMDTNQQLWECKNLMKIMIAQLRSLVYLRTQLWKYASTHHQAPLRNLVQHHHHNNNEYTYHLIAIRHVAANKYIQKFWKQTIARNASLYYVIINRFYFTFTWQIM